MLIETERLLLRELVMADLVEFVALHRDPEVVRYVREREPARVSYGGGG